MLTKRDVLHYGPDQYWSFVQQDNIVTRERLKNLFLPALEAVGAGEETALCLVGSDGKKERFPQSKTEIVILKRDSEPSIRKELTSQFSLPKHHLETAYDGLFGEYTIPRFSTQEPITPLSYQYGNPHKIYPDFILNSLPLDDNPASPSFQTYMQMRIHVLMEMGSFNWEIGKQIREEIRKQLSSYRQGIDSGIYAGQRVFDNNFVYYDEGEHDFAENKHERRFGIKIPFIRSVQRKLDLLTAKFLHENNTSSSLARLFAEYLPTDTPGRIVFLSQYNVVGREQVDDLHKAYLFFLQLQHRCQAEYKEKRQLVAVPIEGNLFDKHKMTIKEFVKPSKS